MEDAKLIEELSKRPELRRHVERLLSISGNVNEEIALADDAEEAAIEACRGIGKAALQNWAESRAEQTAQQIEKRINSANKNIKKK